MARCVLPWLREHNHTCPLCRTPLTEATVPKRPATASASRTAAAAITAAPLVLTAAADHCTLHALRGGGDEPCAVHHGHHVTLGCGHGYHAECLLDHQRITNQRALAQGRVGCPACRHTEPMPAALTDAVHAPAAAAPHETATQITAPELALETATPPVTAGTPLVHAVASPHPVSPVDSGCTLHALRGGCADEPCPVPADAPHVTLGCGHRYHGACLLDNQRVAYARALAQGYLVCPACRHHTEALPAALAHWTAAQEDEADDTTAPKVHPISAAAISAGPSIGSGQSKELDEEAQSPACANAAWVDADCNSSHDHDDMVVDAEEWPSCAP